MIQNIKRFIKMWRNATWADLRPVKPMYKSKYFSYVKKDDMVFVVKEDPSQIIDD
jgi:hypothetical protein